MRTNQYTLGLLIIGLGIFILFGKLGAFQFVGAMLWPLFILVPGVLLHILFFYRMLPSAVLIPGGILTVIALMFFYCNLFGWQSMTYLWPGFILAVAAGLYEFYLFDREHPKPALLASVVLGVIAAMFFGFMILFSAGIYFVALILIAIGVFMMMRRPSRW